MNYQSKHFFTPIIIFLFIIGILINYFYSVIKNRKGHFLVFFSYTVTVNQQKSPFTNVNSYTNTIMSSYPPRDVLLKG